MYLEKLKQFAENLPESTEELNIRMIEVTDELVKIITFIDFTTEDACEDLYKILQTLEFFLYREKLKCPEANGTPHMTKSKSEVFDLINRKLYGLSVHPASFCSGIKITLSNTSLMTLCLLYLVTDVLDNKCHEKLQYVLFLGCLHTKSCSFVVWSLFAILKKSASLDEKDIVLPKWIPRKNSNTDKFCDYDQIFHILITLDKKCSLSSTPHYGMFWEMAQNSRVVSCFETSQAGIKNVEKHVLDVLVLLLESPKFSMKYADKLFKLANMLMVKTPAFAYQVEAFTNMKTISRNVRKFESCILRLENNNYDIDDIMKLLSTFFNLHGTVVFNETKKDLLNMTKPLFEYLLTCEQTPRLEKMMKKNISEVNVLLDSSKDSNFLYSIVSKICPSLLSFDARRNYAKDLSGLQKWQLFEEYFPHLRSEKRLENLTQYISEAGSLFKELVVDKEAKQTFLKLAERNKSTIHGCFNRQNTLTDFLFFIFGSCSQFIPIHSKVNNIPRVIKYLEVYEQENVLSELSEHFKKTKSSDRKTEIAIAFLSLLEELKYTDNEVLEMTENHTETINSMLYLIRHHPQAKNFFKLFQENQHYLSFKVIFFYCKDELGNLSEKQQKSLLLKMLPELESFGHSKSVYDYLVAIETLLRNIRYERFGYIIDHANKTIKHFARCRSEEVNTALMKKEGFKIFSHGTLLSLLKTDPTILDDDTMYHFFDIFSNEFNTKQLWLAFGHFLEKLLKSGGSETEEKMCKILLKLKRDCRYESEFVAKYKTSLNEYSKLSSICSPLCNFFLSIPKLFDLETKGRLLSFLSISQKYDWLDECFSKYEDMILKQEVLVTVDNVCSSIIKAENGGIDEGRIKAITEKHIRLLVGELLPQSSEKLKNLHVLVMPYITEKHDFQIKLFAFQKVMQARKTYKTSYIKVDRRNVLESSYNMLADLSADDWRTRKFKIEFNNEPGVDMGGLLKEWFTITTKEILNPNFGLFIPTPGDVNRYMINKSSHINQDHLKYFKFIGQFLAKGISENVHLGCPLTKVLFKHIVDVPVEHSDFKTQDPEFFNSLDFLLKNPISEVGLDLTFSTEIEHFGAFEEKELIENGKTVHVTDENKHAYVRLVSAMKMTGSIQCQLDAFRAGFYDVISKEEITRFDDEELEMILCGPSEIDIDDLKRNTNYQNYLKSDEVIRWFWEALKSFDTENQAIFLMYATGSSKAPLNGFQYLQGPGGIQKFNICKDSFDGDRLPTARTCFNQLVLPQYTSYEVLREKLLLAIREGTEGFGMA